MNSEILTNIISMISVLMCLAIIVILLWQNATKSSGNKLLLGLMFGLFVFCIYSMLSGFQLQSAILLMALGILLYVVMLNIKALHNYNSDSKQVIYRDDSSIISQAQEQERSRIYANLHDDVGAKLLELVYSAKDETSKNLAKEVLSKIRQAVASTENIQFTVLQLADTIVTESEIRFKLVAIIQRHKIALFEDEKRLPINVPNTILRILREAVSNIIKHSQAKNVTISISSNKDGLNITIQDDGIGFVENKQGKGLKTIKKRADSIATKVNWKSDVNEGTTFTLNYKYVNK